jgi:hypothetical protein
MTETRLLQLGTINGGTTPIIADIGYLGGDRAPVSVTLSTDYTLENPGAGFPVVRPFLTGRIPLPAFPYTVTSGTTIALLQCEADALVAAGAATYG